MAASTAWLTRAGCHCPFCPGCLHGMLHRRVVFQPGWAIMGKRCFVNLLAWAPLGRCRPVEPSIALWCAAPHTKETPPSLPGLLHALQASVTLLLLDSVLLWFVDMGRRDQRPQTTLCLLPRLSLGRGAHPKHPTPVFSGPSIWQPRQAVSAHQAGSSYASYLCHLPCGACHDPPSGACHPAFHWFWDRWRQWLYI